MDDRSKRVYTYGAIISETTWVIVYNFNTNEYDYGP